MFEVSNIPAKPGENWLSTETTANTKTSNKVTIGWWEWSPIYKVSAEGMFTLATKEFIPQVIVALITKINLKQQKTVHVRSATNLSHWWMNDHFLYFVWLACKQIFFFVCVLMSSLVLKEENVCRIYPTSYSSAASTPQKCVSGKGVSLNTRHLVNFGKIASGNGSAEKNIVRNKCSVRNSIIWNRLLLPFSVIFDRVLSFCRKWYGLLPAFVDKKM